MTSRIRLALALIASIICSDGQAVINGRPVTNDEPVAGNTVLIACIGKVGTVATVGTVDKVGKEGKEGKEGKDSAEERVLFTASGVITGDRFILTAAHTFSYCQRPVYGRVPRDLRWEMRFGTGANDAAPISVRFSQNDLLNRQTDASRALLLLKDPAFRDYVFIRVPGGLPHNFAPMALHPDPASIPLGAPVFISGYGIVGKGLNDLKLRTAQLNLTSMQSATPGIAPLAPSTNPYDRRFYLDAYSASEHPCFGDSGAPIYVMEHGKPLLIGIQTQIQTNLSGRAYCDAPVIGLRGDGYIDEMQQIEQSFEPSPQSAAE